MNPVLQSALFSILRWGLALGAGYLIKAGIWDTTAAETYVTAGAFALISLGWSLWTKYKDRIKFLTALLPESGRTENSVNAYIESGAATPSVHTPADTIPGIPKA